MTDEQEVKAAGPRRSILGSDMDVHGNVTVWDHGEPDHDGPPVPLRMHASQAGQALQADPERYAMEPAIDDGEVEAEIEKLDEQRHVLAKQADERREAEWRTSARKAAIEIVLARHAAEKREEEAKHVPGPRTAPTVHFAPSGTSEHPIDHIAKLKIAREPDLPRFEGESDEDYARRNEANKVRMRAEFSAELERRRAYDQAHPDQMVSEEEFKRRQDWDRAHG